MSTAVVDSAGRKKLVLRVARLRHEKRVRFWRVFGVMSFFVIALGVNLYIGAVVITGNFGAALKPGTLTPPQHTAQMRRPMLDGVFCRNITFDNETAQTLSDKVERCDDTRKKKSTEIYVQPPRFTWGK